MYVAFKVWVVRSSLLGFLYSRRKETALFCRIKSKGGTCFTYPRMFMRTLVMFIISSVRQKRILGDVILDDKMSKENIFDKFD